MASTPSKKATQSKKTVKKWTKTPPSKGVRKWQKAPHFVQDTLPDVKTSIKKEQADTTIFTTILALFILAFVVLWGYVYSRQAHKTDILSEDLSFPAPEYQPERPSLPTTSKPVSTSSAVTITPELQAVLSNIAEMLYIESDDILQSANVVNDVVSMQAANWDLYKHANVGDYALQFKNRSILFRPSEQKIINVVPGSIAPQK